MKAPRSTAVVQWGCGHCCAPVCVTGIIDMVRVCFCPLLLLLLVDVGAALKLGKLLVRMTVCSPQFAHMHILEAITLAPDDNGAYDAI